MLSKTKLRTIPYGSTFWSLKGNDVAIEMKSTSEKSEKSIQFEKRPVCHRTKDISVITLQLMLKNILLLSSQLRNSFVECIFLLSFKQTLR